MKRWCWILSALIVAGCSRGPESKRAATEAAPAATHDFRAQSALAAAADDVQREAPYSAVKVVNDQAGVSAAAPADLKIIYNASLGLVVPNFGKLETELPALVRAANGYIAEARSDQKQGKRTSGDWVVRVPTGEFDGFLQRVAALGIAESRQITAEEVTEEYVDLEARVVNKQKMEQRVLEIIQQRSGPLAEVLQLEGELARIREEIELMQGRLRLLANQTSLATVRIAAREEHNYVPPQQPSFATQLRETWQGSWSALAGVGSTTLLAAVALVPWLLFGVPLMLAGALVSRRLIRARRLTTG
jgi:ribosomal protein S30